MNSRSYADADLRLRGRRLVLVSVSDLLPRKAERLRNVRYLRPPDCADPIPNQRGKGGLDVMPIGAAAEIVAARRALMIFARLREESPSTNSVRHLQAAVATAFKVELRAILRRSRRPGPTRIRQIAMMLATKVCRCSRAEVGRRFARNHATVWHAERKFTHMLNSACSTIR